MQVDKGVILYVGLGRLLEVVQLFAQNDLVLVVQVQHDGQQECQHHHQHSPERHQNGLTLPVVLRRLVALHLLESWDY